jgi:hypothetical protein
MLLSYSSFESNVARCTSLDLEGNGCTCCIGETDLGSGNVNIQFLYFRIL